MWRVYEAAAAETSLLRSIKNEKRTEVLHYNVFDRIGSCE